MSVHGSTLRLARVFLSYRLRRELLPYMPIRLWIESSSACNLRCPMCHNREMSSSDKGFMDPALFRKIIDEAKDFAEDVYLHHRGEPFLNPGLFDMIAYAREAGLKTRFHTNATLLDADKAKRLLEAGADFVSISVDGFEEGAYEKARVGAKLETTVRNITGLVEMRRAMKFRGPYVVVERIRFRNPDPPEDKAAIAELTRRFLAAGVDEVITKEEYIWAAESAPETLDQRKCAVCTFPWYAMVICADGTATPCPQDYWAKMNMGNVKDSTLREIWNGARYRELRRAFKTDIDTLPLCRKCDRLHRKTVGGVPFQYMIAFLSDRFVGYGRLRKTIGTRERN